MKAMLASNYDETKLRFPLGAQPKIDGYRGLNMHGALTGRSLKPFKNLYSTAFYSKPEYIGLDGELAAGPETHPELCRMTTTALNTIEGEPFTLWHVFDYITEHSTATLPYIDRYLALQDHLMLMQMKGLCGHLRIVPMQICDTLEELLHWDSVWLDMGYEGTIIRDLKGKHKAGRSTVREGGLLRIKRFTEEEAIVLRILEGRTNLNEAQINELGHTYRTSHQENQTPNGQVGALICQDLKTKEEIKVSAGSMPHDMRKHYFENLHLLIGETIKYKCFPIGVKDLPRFPTFQCIRAPEDMSND